MSHRTSALLLCIGPTILATQEVSASPTAGALSFQVEGNDANTVIVVRQRGLRAPLSHITPGDGAHTRNLSVRFVAGHNLLASWSCGTSCESAELFTPRGKRLANVATGERFDISPRGNVAVVFDGTAGEPFSGAHATVVDLRTGTTVLSAQHDDIWNVCEVQWRRRDVTLLPCDTRTPPISLALPVR